MEARYMITSVL